MSHMAPSCKRLLSLPKSEGHVQVFDKESEAGYFCRLDFADNKVRCMSDVTDNRRQGVASLGENKQQVQVMPDTGDNYRQSGEYETRHE